MSDNVIFEGINLSVMMRNFDRLKEIVKVQADTIGKQKKDIRLCFARIDSLQKLVAKKEDSTASVMSDMFGGTFGKYGRKTDE